MKAKRLVPKLDETQITIAASLLVGLPLFVYIISSVDIKQVTTLLGSIHVRYIGAYLILSALTLIVYTNVWRMFLKSYDNSFSFPTLRLFNFRMAEFAISYVTPGPRNGGEITSGSLLSSYTDITQKTATMAAVMETFVLIVAGLLFDTAMVIIALFIVPKSLVLQIVLATLIGAILLILVCWYGVVERNGGNKVMEWLTDLIDVPDRFLIRKENEPETYAKNHTKTVIKGVVWCLITKVFIAGQMYVLLIGLGSPITFLQAFLLAAAIDIAYTIPSYMGLGALEAGQSGIIKLIGGSVSTGVTIAFITRIRDIIFSGYGLLALSYYSTHKIKLVNMKKPNGVDKG